MANLLAHCLSAMALQSAINPYLGLRFISESSFLAGIVGMAIHLDRDCYNGGRTPYLHSLLFGILHSLLVVAFTMLALEFDIAKMDQAVLILTILPTGFASHLLTDILTEEGIYLFPGTHRVQDWFLRRVDSENSWTCWKKFSLSKNRSNDDPILNFFVSSVSLIVLILLLALTPL